MKERKQLCIYYISYENQSYEIRISDSNVTISPYQKESIAKLKKAMKNSSFSKTNDMILLPKLSNTSVSSEYNSIVIIPDNNTYNIPMDILLDLKKDQKYYFTNTLGKVITSEIDSLKKSNFDLFTFSDELTINTTHPKEFIELDHGYKEVKSIVNIIPSARHYSTKEFTYRGLKKAMKSDMLHISTHASSNSLKRQDCFLLARTKDLKPRKIYYSNIASFDKTPTFVSLSACETGEGVYMPGKGPFSLSKAFLSNGTQTVLKTLWKVDDRATKEFMVKFYERWLTGVSVLDAQYEAKHYMRDSTEFSHPYYWAGFALEGNPYLYLSE